MAPPEMPDLDSRPTTHDIGPGVNDSIDRANMA